MSSFASVAVEAYLAKLFADPIERKKFLSDPASAAIDAGLSDTDANALRRIDKVGLRMAAASYAHKREQHRLPKKKLHELLFAWWRDRRPKESNPSIHDTFRPK